MTTKPVTNAEIPPAKLIGAWADVTLPDVELNGVTLHRAPDDDVPLEGSVTDASMDRSITEASTISLTVFDPARRLLRSGLLAQRSRIKIDAYKFSLASVDTNGDYLTLTFEDLAVGLLSQQAAPRKVNRKTMTRAQFAKLLVDEIPGLTFFAPELKVKQPIASIKQTPSAAAKAANREFGFPPKIPGNLTIKGAKMSKEQAQNIDTILNVGVSMKATPFDQVTAIATVITESSAVNLSGGDGSSIGIFQQTDTGTWGTAAQRHDVAHSANEFFKREIPYHKANPDKSEGDTAQAIQISAYPTRYARWVGEARLIYAAWGGADPNFVAAHSTSTTTKKSAYEFERGGPGHRGENSWAALQRLAQEVNWLCFVVGNTVYFLSQDSLYTSVPIATVHRDTDGIIDIDFSYDLGKPVGSCTIKCFASRWQVDPGAVVMIEQSGPCDGRWVVSHISRSLFDDTVSLSLVKPVHRLPEPAQEAAAVRNSGKTKQVTTGLGSGGDYLYPLAKVGKLIGFPFQGTHTLYNNWQSDNAVDIAATVGTAVFATFDGTIGDRIGSLHSSSGNLQGLRLTINGLNPVNSAYYAHLSRIVVKAGDKVKQGQLLGYSGEANGVGHLHFALEFGRPDKIIEGLTKGLGK